MKIEKSLFEKMGGTYTEINGYFIPNLLPSDIEKEIGVYGQRHLHYIKQYRKVLYVNLLTSTEQLKADNQMEWVQRLNNIRACALEILEKEIIYA